jgi:hypothetical protein
MRIRHWHDRTSQTCWSRTMGRQQCRVTQRSCAAKPLQYQETCQPGAIPCMSATWQSDMTWHSSDHQHHHWLLLARVPLRYRVQPPWGHNVTIVALSYKWPRQTLECSDWSQGNQELSQCLNYTLQYNYHSSVDVCCYTLTVWTT